jgi:two-component system, OmpR family, phosphate regulon response regulator PhoB
MHRRLQLRRAAYTVQVPPHRRRLVGAASFPVPGNNRVPIESWPDVASAHGAALVLLVENDPDNREMYSMALIAAGFSVAEVSSGAAALLKASAMRPAAVVTDLRLGGDVDGLALCERLKADERTRDIPVILLTGWTAADIEQRAKRAGCAAVHLKPVLPDALVNIVTTTLHGRAGVGH